MTQEEMDEMWELGATKCPCFSLYAPLRDLMLSPGVPGKNPPLPVWLREEVPQQFMKKYHPEFAKVVNRYLDLMDKRRAESGAPMLFG